MEWFFLKLAVALIAVALLYGLCEFMGFNDSRPEDLDQE